MKEQNYQNHGKLSPLFHIVLGLLVLALLVISIINFIHFLRTHDGTWYTPVLFLLLAITVTIHAIITRLFSTKLQDRVIRAEENLRYFRMTGKMFDKRITMGQIIALRFAPDEEFLSLAERAVKENLTKKQIKLAVKNWRADNHRV